MSKGSIIDPTVQVEPSDKLIELIKSLKEPKLELTENIQGIYAFHTKDKHKRTITKKELPLESFTKADNEVLENLSKSGELDDKKLEACLKKLSLKFVEDDNGSGDEGIETLSPDKVDKSKSDRKKQNGKSTKKLLLNLNDLKWLHVYLNNKRKSDDSVKYLHEFLEGSTLLLPKNEIIERNPDLEARCQRLRRQQEDRDYNAMTRNVDCSRQHLPDETISYQSEY